MCCGRPCDYRRNMIAEREIPLIAAPMAGGVSTPELAAAVSGAGAFGFLAAGYLSAEALAGQVERLRALTSEPFGVNLFVPGRHRDVDLADYQERVRSASARYGVDAGSPQWDDDQYPAKVDLVITQRIPVVSFTFGPPDRSIVELLHEVGSEVVVTVTTPAEARLAAEVGADLLCVQGMEAGGHRAIFEDDRELPGGGPLYGLLAAIRLVQAEVDLPVIAAGGLVHGADVAAVLAAGAVAAQLGTAFMVCDEAGTQPVHRAEIAAGSARNRADPGVQRAPGPRAGEPVSGRQHRCTRGLPATEQPDQADARRGGQGRRPGADVVVGGPDLCPGASSARGRTGARLIDEAGASLARATARLG
ncbi:hypothetical protein GCM10011581_16360 [Saccharopolyspora subtropica]|uniref:Propionate 3-nitronate monooxygenase n=1 Tax=Saccharopolyspora thermophila TaxID=89367 RepID=A0A917N970_9PSEU|nr:hypothetical protein GCM10011581_16360 [Saccharopolyspora subtropica]